ncbi:MAG: hypothetical protein ACXVPC_10915 [Tumebacillaceae bacterium]
MLKDLFLILFRPKDTLEKVLFENNMRRSWGATWVLTGIMVLAVLVSMIFQMSISTANPNMTVNGELVPVNLGEVKTMVVIISLVVAVVSIGVYPLMRLLFAWFVRMGLRISAGNSYPRDPQERQEKGKLLQLIHPYTLAIQVWPGLILSLIMLFFVKDLPQNMVEMSDPEFATKFITLMLVCVIMGIISLGLYVYLIVVRVMAIKRIYNVSGSQAFWGPFLIYALFSVVPYLLITIGAVILGVALGMHSAP